MEQQKDTFTYLGSKESSSWPTNLIGAQELSEAIHLGVQKINSLAESGYIPHYRIDNGLPLFRISEVKKWCAENLLALCPGKPLPNPVVVYNLPERVKNHPSVPECIRSIVGLCDISTYMRLSGIYFLVKDMEVVYVGQSVNVASRISGHATFNFYKNETNKDFDRVFFLQWPADDLDGIEGAFIRALSPSLNGKGNAPGKKENDLNILNLTGFSK
jgi:hypothetical protein